MDFIQQDSSDLKATHACILLHGLGADGHDLVSFGDALTLPATRRMRFIYPHAPTIAFSQNHGLPCSAWYDFDQKWQANLTQLSETLNNIDALIEQLQADDIAPDKTIIGGFSQGSSVALHALLAVPHQFAGVFSVSGFLPNFADAKAAKTEQNNDTSVLLLHGDADEVVPCICTSQAKADLQSVGYTKVTMQLYPGIGHAITPDQVQTVSHWMESCYSANAT